MLQILIGGLSGIFSGIGREDGINFNIFTYNICWLEQHIAQATNLIYFIPTAISAIIINYRNKNINAKLAIYVSLCGIIGAIIGSIISVNIEVGILRKLFGIFLIFIAIHEIYTLWKEAKKTEIQQAQIDTLKYENT